MFCPTCGAPVSENANFCTSCGAKLTQEQETPVAAAPQEQETPIVAPQEPVVQTPVEEPVVEAPVEEAPVQTPAEQLPWEPEKAPVFAQADFNTEPKKKKRKEKGAPINKKKLGFTLALIGILLAAAAVVTFLFWTPISGFFVRTFGSPEAYFQHVEKQSIADNADTISTYYGTIVENAASPVTSAEGTMQLQVSDKLLQLLGAGAEDLDISWINDAVLKYETVVDDNLSMMNMVLAISDTDIVELSLIVDMAAQEIYIGLPSLNEQYLHFASDSYGSASASMQNLLNDEAFLDALPDEKTVNKLLQKYMQIIIDNTANVDKESDTLEIGGIEQKVTVLEYELTQKGLLKIVKAVLKEARNDKDLKKVINNFADYLEDRGAIGDADSVYDEFRDAMDMAVEGLNYVDASSDTLLVLTDYVDSGSKIIGRKLAVEGQTILEYATVTKGKKFATEIKIAEVVLQGEGTISGDVREGEYVLTAEGVDFLNIFVSYNEKKLEEGLLDGRFRLTPSATLLDAMDLDSQAKSLISGMDLGLELVISNGKKDASLALNLVSGSEVLLGISAEGSATASKEVTLPTNTISDRYADDWAEDLDFSKIVDALQKTKVPSELVELLEDALNAMNDPYGGYYNDYYNDYYNGYYNDYYYG